MSNPALVINKQLFTSQTINSTTHSEESSAIIDIGEVTGFCFHAVWDGNPTGSMFIYGGNDSSTSSDNYDQVVEIDLADGVCLVNQREAHYKYIQVVIRTLSGSSTLNGYFSAKRP